MWDERGAGMGDGGEGERGAVACASCTNNNTYLMRSRETKMCVEGRAFVTLTINKERERLQT